MAPDEHLQRHYLADGPLSSFYAPSPSLSSFGAASVIMSCSARPACSSAPSVLPEDRIGRNSNFELVFVSRNPPDSSNEICYGDLVTEIL